MINSSYKYNHDFGCMHYAVYRILLKRPFKRFVLVTLRLMRGLNYVLVELCGSETEWCCGNSCGLSAGRLGSRTLSHARATGRGPFPL